MNHETRIDLERADRPQFTAMDLGVSVHMTHPNQDHGSWAVFVPYAAMAWFADQMNLAIVQTEKLRQIKADEESGNAT